MRFVQIDRPSFVRLARAGLFVAGCAVAACSSQNSQPVAPIRGGAATPTPTPVSGTPTPTPTPMKSATPTATPSATATPTPPPVSGAQAACVLPIGGATYAFVPGIIASPSSDAGSVGLAEVEVSSGTGILSRSRSVGGSHRRLTPNVQLPVPRAALASAGAARAGRRTFDVGAGGSQILPLIPAPQECAADSKNGDLYIINYGSSIVNVVHVDPTTKVMSLFTTFNTDASSSIEFSGGKAEQLGEAWDLTDNALIVATSTGYELYNGARASSPGTKVRTIATLTPAENFGYNEVTNQVWSPTYLNSTLSVNVVSVAGNAEYALNTLPSGIYEPDQGAVDSSTNIAVASEEYAATLYLVPLSQNALNSPSSGMFSNPNVVTASLPSQQSNGCCAISDISIDSASHLLFSAVEFGSGVGVATLPSSGTGTPAVGPYVFAALPVNGAGNTPALPGDPHAIATFNLSGSGPYGLTYDSGYDTVIVVDMRAMLAAPKNSGDPNGTTLTLGTNVYYIAI